MRNLSKRNGECLRAHNAVSSGGFHNTDHKMEAQHHSSDRIPESTSFSTEGNTVATVEMASWEEVVDKASANDDVAGLLALDLDGLPLAGMLFK